MVTSKRTYLLTPGPTPVHPRALEEMAKPLIHHRTADYERIFQEVREGLRYLFQVEDEVLIFASSGTGGMVASVANLLSRGDKALVVRGGKFGERWAEICQSYGVKVINLDVEWGEAVDPDAVSSMLEREGDVRAVLVQACETSTGVSNDVESLGRIVSRHDDTLLVVDGITAVGAYELPAEKWKLDVVVTGSQKALMLPPGLCFVSLSKKAWRFADRSDLPRYYFDFRKERDAITKNQNAFTPAITLIVGLREVLKEIRTIGLENVFRHNQHLAHATRRAVEALGFELLPKSSPSISLTAARVPEGVDGDKLRRIMSEKFGVIVAGGQGKLKGKIIRIAHMGYIGIGDILMAIYALEMGLNQLGYKVEPGTGARVIQEAMSREGALTAGS